MDNERRGVLKTVAEKTNGIVTPGNVLSIGGVGVVCDGLRRAADGDVAAGLIEATAGAAMDGVDGWLARKTETTSKFGERLDAVCDFAKMGAAAVFLSQMEMVPIEYSAAIFGPKLINAVTSVMGTARGGEVHKENFDRAVEVARYIAIGAIAVTGLLGTDGCGVGATVMSGAVGGLGLVGAVRQAQRHLESDEDRKARGWVRQQRESARKMQKR